MPPRKRRFGRVRKLASGRYQARFLGPDGRDHPADQTFRTVTDAERWLAKKELQIESGQWLDPELAGTTVEVWARRWFESRKPDLKLKTQALYEGLIRLWIEPRLGASRLSDVRPITVTEWLVGLRNEGLSPSRIRTAYRVFAQIMQAAADNDMIAMTPCRGIRLPRLPEPRPRILTDDEVQRLIDTMAAPHDLLVKLLVFAGLRIGEAFALRRGDIDVENGLIVVDEGLTEIAGQHHFDTPKNHQVRVVAIPRYLADELGVHLAARVGTKPTALVFVGRTGKALHYNSWRRAHFDKAIVAAGLEGVTPHDLRATHATWVADRHGVMAAAARLGHSNASVTTRHYARVVDGRDADIARTLDAENRRSANDRARIGHHDDDDGEAPVPLPA